MDSITQDMKHRQSLLCYTQKYGYTRRPESLYRVLRRLGKLPKQKKVKKYIPKPYEPMTHPGERI